MYNYVNEEKFIAWYKSAAKAPLGDKAALAELAKRYMATRMPVFVLAAEESKSGAEESYEYRFENIGCCGASTLYFYL